ncbi:hypothetical protein I0Q12_11070 [Rhodococcus sp. CX]|uniref:hypothetical protein n=1 Tax=Rhodococcus sp. CX TaxID=2789880 RepID=UPI0018CE60DE|nr:hypothetical protein [Rhodococcus sp. CX]MBH0120025.1 hypothetical protein [Rhodococcus sp. CX]
MIKVDATHITTHLTENVLVCELYPGVLVLDTYPGAFLATQMGGNVTKLPVGQQRTFSIPDVQVEGAAAAYKNALANAGSVLYSSWPPPRWLELNR